MRRKRFEIGAVVTAVTSSMNRVKGEFSSSSRWSADASDLEKFTVKFKNEGMKVMLRGSVETPRHGIESLQRNDVGVVESAKTIPSTSSAAESNIQLFLNFPSHKGWAGRASETHIIGFTD